MNERNWQPARLIPTSGINGAEEQERRATSALLAVIAAVSEFGRAVTRPRGAPSGRVETFTEVPFVLGERKLFPDGLIQVRRGQKSWTALVEVKTGTNPLVAEQLENYCDIAREQGFDAVLTISNEIPPVPGQHPTRMDRRKLRKIDLHHLSWTQVLTEAVMQKEFRGVADPDQAWILGELIRYLEHPKSGALQFDDMSERWVPVRTAVSTGTLRPADPGVAEVANRFDALLRFTSLTLGRQLGTEVTPVLSRAEMADPRSRTEALVSGLCEQGRLSGAVRIPNTVGPLAVTADLRAGVITCHVDVDAPREGRPTTRVNWLLRQLRNAPDTVRVESFALRARGWGAAELLGTARNNPSSLVGDPNRELRTFRVALSVPIGVKRGRGRGCFIDSVLDAVDRFYGEVMQSLKSWSPPPPRMQQSEPARESQPQRCAVADSEGAADPPAEPVDVQVDVPAAPEPAQVPMRLRVMHELRVG